MVISLHVITGGVCTHIDDTIFLTGFGKTYRRISPAKRGALVARPETTGCLLTRCSGYCERERHGVICLLTLGDWKNTHRRFCRWRDRGVWEKLLEVLMVEPDYEWLMIDASHCKVHPHAAGAVGGNQAMSRTKGGSTPKYIWPWMRMVCRSELLLQKVPELIARKRVH